MSIDLLSRPQTLTYNLNQMELKGVGRIATKNEYKQIRDYLYDTEFKDKKWGVSSTISHICWDTGGSNILVIMGRLKYNQKSFFERRVKALSDSISNKAEDSRNSYYRAMGLIPERVVNGLMGAHSLNCPPYSDYPFYFNLEDGLQLNGIYGVKTTNLFSDSTPLMTGVGSNKDNITNVLPLYSPQIITSTCYRYTVDKNGKSVESEKFLGLCSACPALEAYDFVVIIHGVLHPKVYNRYSQFCEIVKHDGKRKSKLPPSLYSTLIPFEYYYSNLLYHVCSPIHLINGSNNKDFLLLVSLMSSGFLYDLYDNPIRLSNGLSSIFREHLPNGATPLLPIWTSIRGSYNARLKSLPKEKTVFRFLFPDIMKNVFIDYLCVFTPKNETNNGNNFEIIYNGKIDFSAIMSNYRLNLNLILDFISTHQLNKYAIVGVGFAGCLKKIQNSLVYYPNDLVGKEVTIVYSDMLEILYNNDDGSFNKLFELWSKDKHPNNFSPLALDGDYSNLLSRLGPLLSKSYIRDTSGNKEFIPKKIASLRHDFTVLLQHFLDYDNNQKENGLQCQSSNYKYYSVCSILFTWLISNRAISLDKTLFEDDMSCYLPPVLLSPNGLINYSNLLSDYSKKGGPLFSLHLYFGCKDYISKMENLFSDYINTSPKDLIISEKGNDMRLLSSCGGNIHFKSYLENPAVSEIFKEEREKLENIKAHYQYLREIGVIPSASPINSPVNSSTNSVSNVKQRTISEILNEKMLENNVNSDKGSVDTMNTAASVNSNAKIVALTVENPTLSQSDLEEVKKNLNVSGSIILDDDNDEVDLSKCSDYSPVVASEVIKSQNVFNEKEKVEDLRTEYEDETDFRIEGMEDTDTDSIISERENSNDTLTGLKSYKREVICFIHNKGKREVKDAMNAGLFTLEEYFDCIVAHLESVSTTDLDKVLDMCSTMKISSFS